MNNQSNLQVNSNSLPVLQSERILNHADLLLRIADLKAVKKREEEALKISLSGLASTLNLVSLFGGKAVAKNQAHTPVQSAVNKAVGLVFDVAFRGNRSIPVILSTVLVSKLANTLISKGLPSIASGIGSFFHRRRRLKK